MALYPPHHIPTPPYRIGGYAATAAGLVGTPPCPRKGHTRQSFMARCCGGIGQCSRKKRDTDFSDKIGCRYCVHPAISDWPVFATAKEERMLVLLVGVLMTASCYLVFYQFKLVRHYSETAHLPTKMLKDESEVELPLKNAASLNKFKKAWLPFTSKFKVYDDKIKASGLRRKLVKAGSPLGLLEFLAFKLLAMVFVPIVAMVFLGDSFSPTVVLFGGIGVGFLLPEIWLSRKISKRQTSIRRDLPNIIDLLNLCVSGGLDFMLAVNRVIKDLKSCDITIELAEVYRETQMGKSRKEALKNFAWRIDSPEVYSFVRTLIQAERMGTPIGETLKVQSEEMRIKRFQRGESMALKAPIKLLFPLFVFILPVVLVIVAGPIILQFSRTKIGF